MHEWGQLNGCLKDMPHVTKAVILRGTNKSNDDNCLVARDCRNGV